jgi:GrpB-like predicted nucleotidyltransferase (UPF0157 family)
MTSASEATHPDWQSVFEYLATDLCVALRDAPATVEHVGSTSVVTAQPRPAPIPRSGPSRR